MTEIELYAKLYTRLYTKMRLPLALLIVVTIGAMFGFIGAARRIAGDEVAAFILQLLSTGLLVTSGLVLLRRVSRAHQRIDALEAENRNLRALRGNTYRGTEP